MNDDYEIDLSVESTVGNERHVPSNSYSRAFEFSKLGMGIAMSAASDMIQQSIGVKEKTSFKDSILSESNANRISETLCKMRGAPLKLG